MNSKINVLFLCYDDSPNLGHPYRMSKSLPEDKYNTKLFVLSNKYKNTEYSLIGCKRIVHAVYIRVLHLLQKIYILLRFHFVFKIKKNSEYCYYTNDFIPSYARIILKKLGNFKPDIISIHWVADFISSATIRDLYKKTGAKIILVFTDEQHMLGGCHYPIDCEGYMNGCHNCPALQKGKELSHFQLMHKQENLKNIPLTLLGSPYDMYLATQKSLIFKEKNCQAIDIISSPKVTYTDKTVARKHFGIKDDDFIVLVGSAHINERRKGIIYAIQALQKYKLVNNHLKVLLVGKTKDEDLLYFNGLNICTTGWVSLEELSIAFCASDCFLSTTIGDSGPQMVNLSISLGIPVISFEIGIAATLVQHKRTGYIAKYKDVNDLVYGLEFISNLTKEESLGISNNCKELIHKINTNLDWYEKI